MIAEVKRMWDEATYTPPFKARGFPCAGELSPTLAEWKTLLHTAFCASLRTDEARSTTFRIAYQRDVPSDLHGLLGFESELMIRPELQYSEGDLVKVAHALSAPEGFLWVRSRADDGKFVITGLSPGWGGSEQPADGVVRIGPPASVPQVQAVGIGQLRILKGLTPVCVLDASGLKAMSSQSPLETLVASHFRRFISSLVDLITPKDAPNLREQVEALVQARCQFALRRLVAALVEHGHGGLVAILPDAEARRSELIRVKYAVPSYIFFGLGQALSVLSHSECRVRIPEFLEHELGGQPDDVRRAFGSLRVASYLRDIKTCNATVDAVAALAGVDNAVLLNDQLGVVGFGAEILSKEADNEEWQVASVAQGRIVPMHRDALVKYGTRHRSCYRLCRDAPGALCIVVSQDGAAKVVASVEGDVICFPGLEHHLPS
jgi:hypothetical protein